MEAGENRALLISATGTGKTYASAFAMRELGFRRVLFLVHRAQLARQTKKSFEKVFGSQVSFGFVGGGYYEYDKDYVFATVETLNRDAHLQNYKPEEFKREVYEPWKIKNSGETCSAPKKAARAKKEDKEAKI